MNRRAKFGVMLAVLVVGSLTFVYLNTQYVADPATGDATLSWAPPTERVDGTPLEAVSGYRIYYGRDPAQFEHEIEVDREVTKYRIENLESGDWYFAVAAISEEGLESAPSSVVQKTIEEPQRSLVAVR